MWVFFTAERHIGAMADHLKSHQARRWLRWAALVLVCCCGMQARARAVSVSQLPRDPHTACATPAARAALTTCGTAGPTATCCAGLDAVFANASSASAWCLCIPGVLYKAAVLASDAGLDFLGLLHKCRRAFPSNFTTPWASEQPTACPAVALGATPADLAMQLGDEAVLSSARGRPAWSFTNLLQPGEVMAEMPAETAPLWDRVFSSRFGSFMFLMLIVTPPLFLLLHSALLQPFSREYRRLPAGDRLVVAQHAVYVAVFGACLIPQTMLAVTALFKAWTGSYLASPQLAALLGMFMASRAVLYAIEASVRSVIKVSWLLVVHHQLFFLVALLAMWGKNAATAGIGLVLDLFAAHELPLYVSLVAYRLRWPARATQMLLRAAMAYYCLTRVMQTVMLGFMIAGFARMPAVRSTPEFIVVAVLCGAFTVIQAYTLVIYAAMDKKVAARVRGDACLPAVVQHGMRRTETGSVSADDVVRSVQDDGDAPCTSYRDKSTRTRGTVEGTPKL